MKLTQSKLKQIIKEEIKLLSKKSGYLGNGYKWCLAHTSCPPQTTKTKWWKGK